MADWAALYFNRAFTAANIVDLLTLEAVAVAAISSGSALEAIRRPMEMCGVGNGGFVGVLGKICRAKMVVLLLSKKNGCIIGPMRIRMKVSRIGPNTVPNIGPLTFVG